MGAVLQFPKRTPEGIDARREYDRSRSARKREVRPATVHLRGTVRAGTRLAPGTSFVTGGKRHLSILNDMMSKELAELEAARPKTRADCIDGPRPCPFVSCRHHLYLEEGRGEGSIKLLFPDIEPGEMVQSCSLDVADRQSLTLEETGALLNVTREMVRQIEAVALRHAGAGNPILAEYADDRGGALRTIAEYKRLLRLGQGKAGFARDWSITNDDRLPEPVEDESERDDEDDHFVAGALWENLPDSEDTERRVKAAQLRVWDGYIRSSIEHGFEKPKAQKVWPKNHPLRSQRLTRREEMGRRTEEEMAGLRNAVLAHLEQEGPSGSAAIMGALGIDKTLTIKLINHHLATGALVREGAPKSRGCYYRLKGQQPFPRGDAAKEDARPKPEKFSGHAKPKRAAKKTIGANGHASPMQKMAALLEPSGSAAVLKLDAEIARVRAELAGLEHAREIITRAS